MSLTGVPSKGSASISGGVIQFIAPPVFEGYSEIGYRIQDTNWNIEFFGTVIIFVQSQSSGGTGGANPTPGNTTPTTPTSSTKSNLWVYILGVLLLLGTLLIVVIKQKRKSKKS